MSAQRPPHDSGQREASLAESGTGLGTWRRRSRLFLALLYGTAGILHLAFPEPFLSIVPDWVPYPEDVVVLTGLCELLGSIGLLLPRLSRYAAIALAVYAVCVLPANLKHAHDSLSGSSASLLQWLYHGARLPLQPFLVWLALFAGRVISWPARG
ncbi:DoxX family protein [Neorhizobium sp. NPDC001467]|uniref:DoxX family protein n=1 Tax=Neorhizobium sp. NPDC001467 TaxID=3390595 RepID=UPI003D051968